MSSPLAAVQLRTLRPELGQYRADRLAIGGLKGLRADPMCN